MHIQHLRNERAENAGDEPDDSVLCRQSELVQAIQHDFSLHSRSVSCPDNGGIKLVFAGYVIAICIDDIASVAR